MAYQTGTANSPDDLLDKLRLFAAAQGWTVNAWTVDAGFHRLHLEKSGQWVNLHSFADYIEIIGSTGYSAGSAWNAQPGTGTSARSNAMPGPYVAYHFFAGTDTLYTAVESTPGIFKHLAFGMIEKTCTFTGGAYVGAVYWEQSASYIDSPDHYGHYSLFDSDAQSLLYNASIRADIDAKVNNWMRFTYVTSGNYAKSGDRGGSYNLLWGLRANTPNAFNGLTPIFPFYVFVERPSVLYSPVGYAKDLRSVNMSSLTPGETITLGADQWMVFPIAQKNGPNDTPNSGLYGYAYKKVV